MITPKKQRFAEEYLVDLNATKAAERAGYSAATASQQGARLLTEHSVQELISAGLAKRSERTQVDQDRVVRELVNILEADPNDLVEHRRTCCRYCYGKGFKHQRTAGEMERDREAHQALIVENARRKAEDRIEIAPFQVKGGIGYHAMKDPHPKCPECFGLGLSNVIVKDTRKLSPAARALFAGIKQTKDGMQVLTHSKEGFVTLLMRHAGMLNDKLQLGGGVMVMVKDYTGRKKPDAAG